MRKSKINLAVSREDYQKYEVYFYWIKFGGLALGIIFFIVFLALFINLKTKSDENTRLLEEKRVLLQAMSESQGDEAKIFYLQKKYADLKTFLKDDATSLPYYSLLAGALTESSESSSIIKSFAIDKTREASFTIAFESFPELLNFFKFIESDAFLSKFEKISLKSFSVIGGEDQAENYEISFAGKFIDIVKEVNQ